MASIQDNSSTIDHVTLNVDQEDLNKNGHYNHELDETSSIDYPLLSQGHEPTISAATIASPSNNTRHVPSSCRSVHRDKSRGPPSLQCCVLTKIILTLIIGLWVSIVIWQVVLIQQQREQQEQKLEPLP